MRIGLMRLAELGKEAEPEHHAADWNMVALPRCYRDRQPDFPRLWLGTGRPYDPRMMGVIRACLFLALWVGLCVAGWHIGAAFSSGEHLAPSLGALAGYVAGLVFGVLLSHDLRGTSN